MKILRAAVVGGIIVCMSPQAVAGDATAIVTQEARRQGVPVPFALRMSRIESGVQCNNHNKRTSASGPLQILASTARSLGYRGNIRAASCATQTYYGMMHLAICYRGSKGNLALAQRCHQRGVSVIYGRKHGAHRKHYKRR